GHKFHNDKEAASSKGDENYLHPKSKLAAKGFKPIRREEITSPKGGYWKEGNMLKTIGSYSQDNRVQQFKDGVDLHDGRGNAVHNNLNEPFAVNHGDLPDLDNSQRKGQKDETPRVFLSRSSNIAFFCKFLELQSSVSPSSSTFMSHNLHSGRDESVIMHNIADSTI
ncbi:hypothetical protein RYX36_004328, partial [Vicia faba]